MENTDELIAKLKLTKRIEKEKAEEEKKKKLSEGKKEKITLEEVVEQINTKGKVRIGDEIFEFTNRSFFNDELQIPIVDDFFEEEKNDKNAVSLLNNFKAVSFNATYMDSGVIDKSFEEFKKGIEYGFKQLKFNIEWLEEDVISVNSKDVYYATYKTHTGLGDMYNLIFYKNYQGTFLMGAFNCFYKNIETWELIMKACTMLIKVK